VAWDTPGGVITSTALGTVPGSALQIAAVPPSAHTPNANGCAVWLKARAWSGLNPSWPVSTTLKPQPDPGVPKLTGTVAENDPSAAAVVLVTAVGAPVVVSADATVTADPGAVVPVTVVEVTASVLPWAGAVMVTGSEPGGPAVT